jgi:hypothetical protein
MTALPNYHAFDGTYWETGSIRNALDYAGVMAPHTQKPFSEAMLLGISGGIVVGYFSFAYEGFEPHVALLTRNTFDPMETILTRLAVPRDVHQTSIPATGIKNLIAALEHGDAPIVWADAFSLPYNMPSAMDGMWMMMPLIVYSYDEAAQTACIADRAQVGLSVSTDDLNRARGRVKKDKYRILVLGAPDMSKLVSAVQKGIFDCIKLYTEEPPKGSKQNFGFAALQHWTNLLVKPKEKNSWARVFPRGEKLYAGLRTTFEGIEIFGKRGTAERETYAQFLDEAALLLNKPALTDVANVFREAGKAWTAFGQALLPDSVPVFKEARELLLQQRELFLQTGAEHVSEIRTIHERLRAIRSSMVTDFPLSESDVQALMQDLRGHILRIHDIEMTAVQAMQEAMR